MSADYRDFLSHGGFLPDQPIQPPEPARLYVVPRAELTQAEKLKLILRMAKPEDSKWRRVLHDAIPEAALYDWYLGVLLGGDDIAAGEWARHEVIDHFQAVMEKDCTEWEDFL
jgi:hypothetical protein